MSPRARDRAAAPSCLSAARRAAPALLAALTLTLGGCNPSLDWREARPAGLHLRLTLPCHPDAAARRLLLGGNEVELQLWVCSAGGTTFALSSADVGDPRLVGAALVALGAAARANIAGRIEREEPARVPEMTPHPEAKRWRIAGSLPDGRAVTQEVAVFAYGHRVYQASAVAVRPDALAVRTFFDGLQVLP